MSLHRILSREVLRAAGAWAWSQLQGASAPSPGAPGKTHNPLEKWTDHDLVRAASGGGDASAVVQLEMMRRLREALEKEHAAAVFAARRVETLFVRLVWIALGLGALIVVQLLVALRVIG